MNWLRRIKFALALTDADIEDLHWLVDQQLTDRVNTKAWSERLHRLHDLLVDAA